MAETLLIDWPDGLETISETVGMVCRVKIKHKEGRNGQTFENAYIETQRSDGEPASPDQIKEGIAKLKDTNKPDDRPFG